jgi:hypothetical protein
MEKIYYPKKKWKKAGLMGKYNADYSELGGD